MTKKKDEVREIYLRGLVITSDKVGDSFNEFPEQHDDFLFAVQEIMYEYGVIRADLSWDALQMVSDGRD